MAYSAKIAEAFVDIKTNTKNYERGISGVKSSLKKLGVIAAAAFAAKKLFEFGKSAVSIANDFEETRNRFKVVFAGIGSEAEEASNRIASSFDLAEGTAKTMLAATGDLLTGFGFGTKEALEMSESVAKLAGDLASWSNIEGGAEEAAKRLTSAMLGETEATKALGIKIDQQSKSFRKRVKELKETKGMTEAQAKAQVILAQAYAQSNNALGDYANTRDSFANQQRALNEQWKQFKDSIGKVIIKFIEMSGIMPKILKMFKGLNERIKKLSEGTAIEEWFIKIKTIMKKVWIALKTPWEVLGTFIGVGLARAIDRVKKWYLEAKDFFKDLTAEEQRTLDNLKASLEGPGAFDAATKKFEEAADAWADLDKKASEAIKKVREEHKKAADSEVEVSAKVRDKVVEDEKKKKKAKQAAFFSAEQLLERIQQGVFRDTKTKATMAGAAPRSSDVSPPEQKLKAAAVDKRTTQQTLSDMLSQLKTSNSKLSAIQKNTAEFAVFA